MSSQINRHFAIWQDASKSPEQRAGSMAPAAAKIFSRPEHFLKRTPAAEYKRSGPRRMNSRCLEVFQAGLHLDHDDHVNDETCADGREADRTVPWKQPDGKSRGCSNPPDIPGQALKAATATNLGTIARIGGLAFQNASSIAVRRDLGVLQDSSSVHVVISRGIGIDIESARRRNSCARISTKSPLT